MLKARRCLLAVDRGTLLVRPKVKALIAGESRIRPSCKLATKNFLIAEIFNFVALTGVVKASIDKYLTRVSVDGFTGSKECVLQKLIQFLTCLVYIRTVSNEILLLKHFLNAAGT